MDYCLFLLPIFSSFASIIALLYLKERQKNREIKKLKQALIKKQIKLNRELKELEIKKTKLMIREKNVNKKEKELQAKEFKLWIRSSLFLVYPLVQMIYSYHETGSVPEEAVVGLIVSFFIFIFGGMIASKLFKISDDTRTSMSW